MSKELTKNQRYEKKLKEAGLEKVTVWCPTEAKCYLKEMMTYINEQYQKPVEERKKLVPFMFRNLETGVMGKPK